MICALFVQMAMAQQDNQVTTGSVFSLIGATAHIGNGEIIENAVIVLENGRIARIGTAEQISPEGEQIEVSGQHVYPGFIMPNSTLGLGEIDAVRATRDFDETGSMLPHVRSLIAYNAESKVIETVRPNGILLAQITPRGGRISGTSSIVQLDAWNWEDAALKEDDAIHVNWPSSMTRNFRGFGNIRTSGPSKTYSKEVGELKDFLSGAKAYGSGEGKTRHLPYEAMQGVFNGSKKLFVHASREKEIIDAISTLKRMDIGQLVLVGGDEAHLVSDLLIEHQVPVLVKRVHSLPSGEDVDYDLPYKRAVSLFDKGLLVALENSGGMERMNSRNLPFYAGTLTGHGMDKEEALQLITLNPAKILGIDKDYGSLEAGKSATLFVSEGDALEMRSNKLSRAYIDGREIDLETHQTRLWKKYMDKYEAQSK